MRLIAFNLVVEFAIQSGGDLNSSQEWSKGGDHAISVLMLSDQDLEDWVEDLQFDFAAEK